MCRAAKDTADGKPLRCEKCNEPQTRRDRQNLANAIKREEASSSPEESSEELPREPDSLAAFVELDVQNLDLDDEEQVVVIETVQDLLTDPEVVKELAEKVRKAREEADSNRAWLLGGREDTPENLAIGLAERQQEILLVGTAIADRAQEIHGVDLEQARRDWEERVPAAKEAFHTASAEAREAEEAFQSYRLELTEKHGIEYYDFDGVITPEEEEEFERLRAEKNSKLDLKEALGEEYRNTMRGHDKETAAVLDKIAAGNKQALAEVRSVGNVPVEFTEKVRGGGAGEVFIEAVSTTFPDEWVQKSNEKGPLSLVRTTDREGRVHYSPVQHNISPYNYIRPDQPDPRDDRFTDWRPKLDEQGNPTGKWEGLKRDVLMEYPDPRTFKKYNKDGTPKGTGWKRGTAVEKGQLVPIWVRDNETDKKNVASRADTGGKITVNMRETHRESLHNYQHEFSHRIEDSNPHITVLEEAFIASRTTDANGERHPLKRYEENPSERVRADNFVKPYMGKEYEGQPMREILSMGTESVFGGNHGGLVGIGENRVDLEMRNWILGLYATA